MCSDLLHLYGSRVAEQLGTKHLVPKLGRNAKPKFPVLIVVVQMVRLHLPQVLCWRAAVVQEEVAKVIAHVAEYRA